jgi:hypothetical protein
VSAAATVWHSWFGWPDGGVWSNLAAAVLWATPAFTVHHRLMRRHQSTTVRVETAKQTEELKAHIDARMEGRQP